MLRPLGCTEDRLVGSLDVQAFSCARSPSPMDKSYSIDVELTDI